MNRPSLFSYLIGNPVSGLVLVGGSGFVLWQWWEGRATGLAAFLAVIVMSTAVQAGERLSAYQNWKRQWDAMAGIPPARPLLQRIPGLRALLLVAIWLGFGYYVSRHPGDQLSTIATLPYLIGGPIILLVVMLWRIVRWIRRGRRKRARLAPVALLLKRPRRSPSRADATRALPDYCKPLLQRRP